MGFTSNVGERNGVYLNIAREKNGYGINLTIRCTICGKEFHRASKTLMTKNLNTCMCDKFDRGEKYKKKNRSHGVTVKDQWYSRCKWNFEMYLKKKLKENPDLKHDDFDKIWAAVGERPKDTPFCRWYLTRKYRGQRNPDSTADNFEWHAVTTSKAIRMAESLSSNTHRSCRRRASMAKGAASEEDFLNAVQKKIRQRHDSSKYDEMVGKKKKSFRILDVIRTVSVYRSCYTFRMKCEHCGKEVFREASKVLNNCKPCSCRCHAGRQAKNSSVAGDSVLMKKKYKQFVRTTVRALSQDEILLMQAHISEFTLYEGTPEYIQLKIDSEIMGLQP